MYCEIHGSGPPLVLLHGGALTIGLSFGPVIPALAESHGVIAVEMQGHGPCWPPRQRVAGTLPSMANSPPTER
jgi:pimeloyl-ACP methyl ester carboxylesterase